MQDKSFEQFTHHLNFDFLHWIHDVSAFFLKTIRGLNDSVNRIDGDSKTSLSHHDDMPLNIATNASFKDERCIYYEFSLMYPKGPRQREPPLRRLVSPVAKRRLGNHPKWKSGSSMISSGALI